MLIIGLGNPGKEYEKTRHNVGFWCVDKIAKHFKTIFEYKEKYIGEISEFKFDSNNHFILKPMTYMNNSGESLYFFLKDFNIPSSQIIVIEDDINLPVGKIRIRSKGSSGGHNGLKSIISVLGEDFWRIRIGVGLPRNTANVSDEHENLISHVLGELSESEILIIEKVLNVIPEITQYWLSNDGEKAMNKFNSMSFNQ